MNAIELKELSLKRYRDEESVRWSMSTMAESGYRYASLPLSTVKIPQTIKLSLEADGFEVLINEENDLFKITW